MTNAHLTFLRKLPIFEGLTDGELTEVANALRVINGNPGDYICREGGQGDAFYVLETGSAAVSKRTAQGDDQVLAQLQAPSVIGEMSLLDGSKRSASVRATSEVRLLRLGRQEFLQMREAWNVGAYKMIRNIANTLCVRLRETNERVDAFFADPEQSLAKMQARQQQLTQERLNRDE